MTEKDYSNEETAEATDDASLSEAPTDGFAVRLIDVLTQIVARRRLIGMVTGAATLLGVLYSLMLPAIYTSTTKLMTPQQTQSSAALLMTQLATSGTSSLAAVASSGLGLRNPNDVYIGLLNSRSIAETIIQQFGLEAEYKTKDIVNARKALAANTRIISEKSGFLSISVTDRDRQRSAEIANAYTNQLRIFIKTLAVTEASQRRLFYEDQLRQAKEALVSAELALEHVQQDKGLVQLDAQAKAMIEGIAALRAQVAAKQVEVQALRSYSTEQNPDVQLAERELTSLQAEESRLEQSNHRPGIAGLGLGNVPAAGLEYLSAEHELQYRQALYDMLMKQYDAAKLDEAKDAAIIQVVEPAVAPSQKSSPHRTLIVFNFMVFGFLASCILVRALSWKNVFKSAPVVADALGKLKRAYTSGKLSRL